MDLSSAVLRPAGDRERLRIGLECYQLYGKSRFGFAVEVSCGAIDASRPATSFATLGVRLEVTEKVLDPVSGSLIVERKARGGVTKLAVRPRVQQELIAPCNNGRSIVGGNMRPGYIALIFWVLAAGAAFGIVNSLRTGIANGVNRSYPVDEEPIGFMMVILVNVFFIGFAIAETLYALRLSGDPMAALRSHIPFGLS